MVDYKSSHGVNIICEKALRYSFVSHLYAALRREGISVYVIADKVSDYQIQGARISVVVLSEVYAFSLPWNVLERRNDDHKVIPVFYGVNPPVRNRYDESLRMVPETGGGHQSRNSSERVRNDAELVEDIVRDVYGKLYPTERIGIYPKLMEIDNLLCEQSWDVRSLGIWGMPGIGKTTLAKAVFDHMSNDYDASCFIEKFDEALHKAGTHHLLEEKICKILEKKSGVSSSGIARLSLLRDKLCDTRILVVLDDVRNPLVAESFLGRLDWFGPGSLIIITSRYKQVFALCQISQIYEIQCLNNNEALQLFSQCAFEKDVPEQIDKEHSMKVIDYANGNPLALCIYGQELKGKNSEMEAAFLELKQCPPKQIQDGLKSVYSALGDNEKYIFLEIVCFFKGEDVDYVVQLLKGCGYFPRVGIDVLVEKCLVTISENKLHINDLIQDIIREIIIGERKQMERCTTLWQPSSIRYLLEDDELKADGEPKETPIYVLVAEDIEGISLDISNLTFDVNPDAFKRMVNLRFLKVYNSYCEFFSGLNFPKGLNSLPCELRLLHWENYPFESLPQSFDLQQLVELNMPYSQLRKLEARTKNLGMLKRIRLCHSWQLVKFSIQKYAQNTELIDLQGCTRLESCPSMTKLKHLRVLNLSGCTKLNIVPGLPPNIEELYLEGTSIEDIPISIVPRSSQPNCKELMNHIKHFPGLEHIDLESVTNLIKVSSYNQGIGKLVCLNMKDCLQLRSLPDMFDLESLQVLDLSGCSRLEEIKGFPGHMKELYLAGTGIRELPKFPESLEFLNAHDCALLESVHLDFEQLPKHYTFSNCFNLSFETTAGFLEKSVTRVIRLVREQNQEHFTAPGLNICIPADACQRSSLHWRAGSFVSVELPPCTRKALSGFAMSVLVSFRDDYHNAVGLGITCICTWKTKTGYSNRIERVFQCWAPKEAPRVEKDHIFVFYDAEMHPGVGKGMDQIMSADNLIFEFHTVSGKNNPLGDKCVVTDCDIRVIMDSTGDTSVSAISRVSEDISIIEELPHFLKEPEAKICSPSSSKPHKPLTVASKRLRDLEGEINELRDSNMKLHFENFELAEKLESVQIIANSKLEDPEEIETLREDGNRLRSENEELKKEVEQLQGDRCTDLEELVYLRWINACLRYELRTYQPPPGKTVARDLSTTLSPNSEEKARQLILEYAHSEGHEEDITDYDRWSNTDEESSMITESMFLDDSSVDTLYATKTEKSGKKQLMHKLMKILHGKDSQDRKKRAGSSEPSCSSTVVNSSPRQLRSTHSMDFQMLMCGKDVEEDFKNHIEMLHGKSEAADSSTYGEEHCLDSDQNKKKELIKFAEALTKSRSTKKLHKKSVSFFF